MFFYSVIYSQDPIPKKIVDVKSNCEKLPDRCSINVCKTEAGTAVRLMDLFFKIAPPAEIYLHSSGFNFVNECQNLSPPSPGEKFCCGNDYPDKFVYRSSFLNRRECCGDHTYDSSSLDCCNDGTSKAIGSCPP